MQNSSYGLISLKKILKFKLSIISFTVLFLVAAYVMLGRAALIILPDYQHKLEILLSEQIQSTVKIKKLSGRWVGFDPIIDIDGLSINGAENAYIGRVRLRLAFLPSLFALAPRFKSIDIEHSALSLFQNAQGTWNVAGFELPNSQASEKSTDLSALNEIFNGAAITLQDNSILLRNKKGKTQSLHLPIISLRYLENKVFASGKILQEGGEQSLLNFSLEGRGVLSEQPIAGTLYLEARSSEFFDRILKDYTWKDISLQNVDASARLWLTFDGLNVNAVQGDLQVHKINWKSAEKSLPPILNAALGFEWSKSEAASVLSINGFGLSWAGKSCHSSDIEIVNKTLLTQISASYLDVACLSGMASAAGLLPYSLQDRLDISQPSGLLKNIELKLRRQSEVDRTKLSGDTTTETGTDASSFEPLVFSAELENVSLFAYTGTPSLKGVDGYVNAGSRGGSLYLDSTRFELGFPNFFEKIWRMKRTEGAINWLVEGDDLTFFSEGLRLQHYDDSLVYGDFILRLNPPEKEDYLSLQLGMQDIAFTDISNFVPVHIIGDGLSQWLDTALLSGQISEGIYVGHGSIEDDSPEHSFTSSLYLKTNQGQLSFAEDWPNVENINAEIQLQNSVLEVTADTVKIEKTILTHLKVNMPETQGDESGQINIQANVLAGDIELNYWLKESPIAAHTKSIIEQLEIQLAAQKTIHVALNLDVSLDSTKELEYLITNTFDSVNIKHIETDLLFEDVTGVLIVSSVDGVSAQNIQTNFFGQKAIMNLLTIEQPISKTLISIDSGIRIESLLGYFDQEEIKGLSGGFNYHAELSLPNQKENYPNLTLQSDLRGVSYDWPKPINKDYLTAGSLDLNLLIKPDQMYLDAKITVNDSPDIESELFFVDNKFTFGEVLIGGVKSRNPDVTGLNIVATLDEIKLEPWLEFVQDIVSSDTSEPDSADLLKRIDLEIGRISAYGQTFKETQVLLTKPQDYWQIDLKGEDVQGRINIPTEKSILDIQLDHLVLSALASADPALKEKSLEKEDHAKVIDPRQLPEMKFLTNKLLFNQLNYGTWQAHLHPSNEGAIFSNIKGKIKGTSIEGQLNWKVLEDQVHTSILTLDVQGDKVEEFTKAIGRPPVVSSETYEANVALVWPGDPFSFELAKISGSLSLNMKDGFLNTEDAKTGVLRLFGILNAESIVRRLKLDFSDLYKSGVSYDVLSVKAKINQGLLTLSDPLLIDGPSSSYVINGSADLSNETLDLDMLVELPFVQNLPLAALILGAPQIGGAVWLIDKILGEPLSSLTNARYDITGSWSDPKMELHQVMNASKKDRSNEKRTR